MTWAWSPRSPTGSWSCMPAARRARHRSEQSSSTRGIPIRWALLDSIPPLTGERPRRLPPSPAAPPSLLDLPQGCAFAPRCRVQLHRAAASTRQRPTLWTRRHTRRGLLPGWPQRMSGPHDRQAHSSRRADRPSAKRFAVGSRFSARRQTHRACGRRCLARRLPRRDGRARRRIRLRQVHARALPGAALRHHRRASFSSRATTSPTKSLRRAAAAAARACRWSSRTRMPRSIRAGASATSSPSRCASIGKLSRGRDHATRVARADRARRPAAGSCRPLPA